MAMILLLLFKPINAEINITKKLKLKEEHKK